MDQNRFAHRAGSFGSSAVEQITYRNLRFLFDDVVAEDKANLGYRARLVIMIARHAERVSGCIAARMHQGNVATEEEASVLEGRSHRNGSAGAARAVQQINRILRWTAGARDVF